MATIMTTSTYPPISCWGHAHWSCCSHAPESLRVRHLRARHFLSVRLNRAPDALREREIVGSSPTAETSRYTAGMSRT